MESLMYRIAADASKSTKAVDGGAQSVGLWDLVLGVGFWAEMMT